MCQCGSGVGVEESTGPTHLFDAVGVDGCLWLHDADWFSLLGALRHLADFLCDEVVDAIESLDCTLYQTHSLCGSYTGGGGIERQNYN